MPSFVATIAGSSSPKGKRGKKGARRTLGGGSCTLGDSRRVNAGKGYTQELACTGKGPTGWSFVKGTRRRGR